MKRVVFLVDMNAFFISCEGTRHPEIKGQPAAVAGDPENRTGIILTASYEARKCGVRTAMVLRDALRLCPNLIVIPPDHGFYEKKSREVMNVLSSYTPVIEQNSIDEAWLDMTGTSGLFGEPLTAAKNIMERIKSELGLWCSIGISENKFLAKMASEMKKPLGITELWEKDIRDKMWPMPVGNMYGVGKQTAIKLQNMGIATIRDLASSDREYLVNKLGKMGGELHLLANGIDMSPVSPHGEGSMKSIGRSVTLPHDITEMEDAKKVLLELSDDIGMTARKYDKKGHTVQITIKYANFKSITRQMSVPSTCLVRDIYNAGLKLLSENWSREPVRLIGISISGFNGSQEREQMSLFELPKSEGAESNKDKIDHLENAIHNIRQKYGASIIKPGVLVEKESKKQR